MPSQLHEALVQLFRNRPELAPELLREALHAELPAYTEARIDSAELSDVQPAEYRADLVVLLYDGKPVLGIVIEVQLTVDQRKRFAWPAYAANLRSRLRCPACVLVVTAKDAVARWAAAPIDLGAGNQFVPLVLGPAGVPEISDEERAKADPELAVLSAMAHGRGPDPERALTIAIAAMSASVGLDPERSTLYFDLVVASLSEAARKRLQAMDPAKHQYQSDFAKRYFSQGEAKGKAEGQAEGEAKGKAEGEAKGRADLLLKLMALKFRKVPAATVKRIQAASAADLELWAGRVLSAKTLAEVFKPAKLR